MNIDKVIEECAKDCGLPTYLYARIREANVRMDDVKEFPMLWRQFNDRIGFTKFEGQRRRNCTFHFLDLLSNGEPDTDTEVLPLVSDMETRCYAFLKKLKSAGCDFDMTAVTLTPTVEYLKYLDTFVAGIRCEIAFTYNICR